MKVPARYKPTGKTFDDGGMGDTAVYKDSVLERLVIIKRLQIGVEKKRLLDEIAALQTIRSPHVVQVYDVIEDDDGEIAGIIEEYLDGDDLTSVVKPTTFPQFLATCFSVAKGIADIHSAGRIHRDIKRQNMKYDSEKCLKIFDFGLSRTEGVDADTVGAVGTPGYMAPELFSSAPGAQVSFTQAVDVFAFASTCLAVCVGKLPADLRKMPPALPSQSVTFKTLSIGMPSDVVALLDHCFSTNPADRPRMAEVVEQMERHLLKDRHRALLVYGGGKHILDASQRTVNLSVTGQGSLTISYDGFGFVVSNTSGNVFVNNMAATDGMRLPGACVIVLGDPSLGNQRTSITLDVSHPEVSL